MRITVIGAGVVGVATAYYLSLDGHDVTVVDRNTGPGEGTSFANGGQLSVSNAEVLRPIRVPTVTSERAKWRACSADFISAPEPNFTSSTRASMPSAIFLDKILAVINGILSTVAVTSRNA